MSADEYIRQSIVAYLISRGQTVDTLRFFASGPVEETHGLFGSLSPEAEADPPDR